MHIAVIGGGAAGHFAAITALETRPDAHVVIYEAQSDVLKKVAITGGGRCNVTNSFEEIASLKQTYPRGHSLMKRLLKQFDHRQLYQWFEDRGVMLTTQEDQCVFPVSQDAQSIIHCLTGECRRLGAKTLTSHRLEAIEPRAEGGYRLHFKGCPTAEADRVVIATGGHPQTAQLKPYADLGLIIEPPVPSLFTLTIQDQALTALMGTVVEDAQTTIVSTKLRAEGPLLITHWGMSGPAILKLSSQGARYLAEHDYKVQIAVAWTGAVSRRDVEDALSEISVRHPQKQLASVRPFSLPSRLWSYLLQKVGLSEERRWAEVGQRGMNRLIEVLTNDTYPVASRGAFRDEFVTCGGVALSNLDSNTLECRTHPGLFFAGEVTDVDAITGGFNLQAAWTMGYVAGRNVVNADNADSE